MKEGNVELQGSITPAPLNVKCGTFTRDVTSLGDQVFSSFGFQPKAIWFNYTILTADGNYGVGMATATDEHSLGGNVNNSNPDRWRYEASGINIGTSVGNLIYGSITIDSDGFTVTWTDTGTPTGTIRVNYMAIG